MKRGLHNGGRAEAEEIGEDGWVEGVKRGRKWEEKRKKDIRGATAAAAAAHATAEDAKNDDEACLNWAF